MKLSALHALQKLMARPDAAEVFKQFDTDGDGTVRDPYTPGYDALLGCFPGVLLGYVPVTLGQHLPAWLFPVAGFRFWLLVLIGRSVHRWTRRSCSRAWHRLETL